MMPGAALVWCPFPEIESARVAADALLDDRLIACANILGSVESRFVWDGARAVGSEVGVLCKTTSERLEDVIERLGELHPYDTPAVIGWHADAAHPATFTWLAGSIPG
ncbi:divalent-cation tolerance protein CutA [Erythrobacter donghaensis]|uniref:divalent-cation tolerance protein CutA n=1 Tax=Erythrobacter donghaensis TaxID=267135 RepID=UPI000A38B1B0|nr:divalent-cation tolerance protein CutA [Erythrobacter donghaensis]